jgi:hypothetical protein
VRTETVASEGHTYNYMRGTLTLSAAVFIPLSNPNGFVTVPAIISGQLFAVDCTPENADCYSCPAAFGFNILGAGTVTVDLFNMGNNNEGVGAPEVSWVGVAVETPEPPGWSLVLGAFLAVLIAKRARLLSSYRDTAA